MEHAAPDGHLRFTVGQMLRELLADVTPQHAALIFCGVDRSGGGSGWGDRDNKAGPFRVSTGKGGMNLDGLRGKYDPKGPKHLAAQSPAWLTSTAYPATCQLIVGSSAIGLAALTNRCRQIVFELSRRLRRRIA